MIDIKSLLKNKFLVTAATISLLVFVVILLLSPKKNSTPAPSGATSGVGSALSAIVPLNLSQEKKDAAAIYVDSISGKLPLTVESFMTSVGIETIINITHSSYDPAEIVRLNIGGLSYINKNELDETKNPNVTAFKESYLKAVELLESQNIDPRKLIFVYSDQSYVRETASYWVDMLKLPHL